MCYKYLWGDFSYILSHSSWNHIHSIVPEFEKQKHFEHFDMLVSRSINKYSCSLIPFKAQVFVTLFVLIDVDVWNKEKVKDSQDQEDGNDSQGKRS